jgi:hypothetical protein
MLRKIFLLALLAALLTSCAAPAAVAPTPELPTAVPTEIPSPTPLPPATRVLFTGSGLPAAEADSLFALSQTLAAASSLTVDKVDALSPEVLTPDVRMVIALPGTAGLPELAARFPAVSFISIANSGTQPAANLFAVGSEGAHPEWVGFMAGYIAAVTTYEWRVGALAVAGDNTDALAADAFLNGAVFFCGLCNPYHPPWTDYPAVVAMNPPTTQADWQPWADNVVASKIQTVYIAPGASNPDMLAYLANAGIRLIGGQTPPDAVRPAWIATIRQDYTAALTTAWGEVLAAAPGRAISGSLTVTDLDSALIGDGKMRLIQANIDLLTSGHIAPNTIP